jgi:hypothetical protein
MRAVKKPATFPQGTQRIARIDEEPAVEGPITDAELASALVGSQLPVAACRAKRMTNAYSTEPVIDLRPILTVA